MLLDILLLVVGLAMLLAGAQGLVRGAASVATKSHISPLAIGLTVVSTRTDGLALMSTSSGSSG